MKLGYDSCFAVVLCHQESTVVIDDITKVLVPACHKILLNCQASSHTILSDGLIEVIKIDHCTIRDFLASTTSDAYHLPYRPKKKYWEFISKCIFVEVFSLVIRLSKSSHLSTIETYYHKRLLHLLLYAFSTDKDFIPYLVKEINLGLAFAVQELIMSDLTKNWSLDSIARLLFVSSSTLKKKLKQEGTSYQKILVKSRMQYAAKQLSINSNLTISQLAEQCGYSHLSYFIFVFKNHYGVTPYQFCRKQMAA